MTPRTVRESTLVRKVAAEVGGVRRLIIIPDSCFDLILGYDA